MDERKVATALFADLVGSTELGGSQDPERTRAMLERFYDAMAAEIVAAGGTVEKFAGDAVMAAFGAPAAYEDHAERALHAALAMRERLATLFGGALELRIGVNTGDVVVGLPREGSSFVTGDAVNVAARLEQAAAAGEILVGERTVAASRDAFEFGQPMTVEAKGKADGVPCRRLVRSLSLVRPRGGLGGAFVGREAELDRLLDAYRATVEERRPRLVTLVGDAGVGKTRLVRELWDRLRDERPEPLRRIGRCLPYGRGITYWPLGEILREQLGIGEGDPPAEIRRRLGDREILGLTLGLDVAADLHPLAVRDRFHDAWIGFVDALVAERPLVALVEDVHWAEPALLDLLEALAREVAGPLLLLGTARPDFVDARAGWGTGRYQAETIWLEPLSAASAAELVDSVLGQDLRDDARRRLLERAEGNPLFIEELLSTLLDRGVVAREDGGLRMTELPADLEVPDTVQAVVAARIDLLGPAEKAALQAAALVGRVFWTGAISELVQDQPDLRVLEDRDFVRRRAESSLGREREYAFKHAITREVAYESIPKARRARWHADLAEWIVRTIGERDEVAPILAHHLAAAAGPEAAELAGVDEPDRLHALRQDAVRWLRRAGELAMHRYELDDAAGMFRQAVDLEPERDAEVELWRLLGRAAALRYDGVGLWDAMERAVERCEDPRVLGELYAELALQTTDRPGMWTRFPDHDRVQGWIDRALELTEPGTHARCRAVIALCYWQQDRPAWALEEAEELSERLGDPALRIGALETRSFAEFAAGAYEAALDSALRAVDLERRHASDPDTGERLREEMASLFVMCGRLAEARELIEEHAEVSRKLFPHHRLHSVSLELELYEVLERWDEIRSMIPRVRDAVRDNAATPCVRGPRSLLVCAAACAAAGNELEADRLEREARELQVAGFGWIVDAPLIRLALHRHDLAEARRLIAESDFPITRRQTWYFTAAVAAHFDALIALGDRERVDRDAAEFLGTNTVLTAFATRALGSVRDDQVLLAEAATLFERYGFDDQAAKTRARA